MSDVTPDTQETPKKSSKLPLILGIVLALVGGGGGFYATWSGLILGSQETAKTDEHETQEPPGLDIAYVAVEPLTISLRGTSNARHLRFRAHLEVPSGSEADVSKILPRIVDVLNSYLRALEPTDLEDPSALVRLRSQMLRRVQIVSGDDMINDLLIMEFVLT